MKSKNLTVATLMLCVVAASSSAYAQDSGNYRIRVTGVVPDICRASAQSVVVDGDRLIVTVDRMCNRAHVLRVAAGTGRDALITESRTGRTVRGDAAFVSASPQQGVETLVIRFDGADRLAMAKANIRLSVAPVGA